MSKQQKEIIPREESRLFIDIGNSTLKAGVADGQQWMLSHQSKRADVTGFVNWINRYSGRIGFAVITSVVEEVTEAVVSRLKIENCRILTLGDIPGDLLDYESPETLGLDRFFGCYAAVSHTDKAAVVIDAGSACTVDYMAGDYIYRGGVIIPGLTIVEKALNDNIPALPPVEREIPDQWPGKSTKTCLQWGIAGTYLFGIEKLLEKYGEAFGDFDLVATGGHAKWMSGHLKGTVKVRPELVLDGMKVFLEDYL